MTWLGSAIRLTHLLPLIAAVHFVLSNGSPAFGETVALWLFDEQVGIYPSCVLNDASANDYPMALGPGGQVAEGKFAGALEPREQPKIELSRAARYTGFERRPTADPTRKVPPMDWSNANFCALMTRGE